jgi:hypothetical protein
MPTIRQHLIRRERSIYWMFLTAPILVAVAFFSTDFSVLIGLKCLLLTLLGMAVVAELTLRRIRCPDCGAHFAELRMHIVQGRISRCPCCQGDLDRPMP